MDFYLGSTVFIQHRSKKGKGNYSSRTDILWYSNLVCKFYLISCSEQYWGIKLQISCNEDIILLPVIFAFGEIAAIPGLIYLIAGIFSEDNGNKHRQIEPTQFVCMGLPYSCNFFRKQRIGNNQTRTLVYFIISFFWVFHMLLS